jgi:hypothetical protein
MLFTYSRDAIMRKPQLAVASTLALVTSFSQGSGLEGTFQSQWQSRYVTEGRDNLDSNPLVSAGVDLTHQEVTFGVWQAWANGSDYRENNLFVEYAPFFEHWTPYLNVTYLQFHPQGADDVETGAGFSVPLQPWLSLSLDGTWSKQADGAFYALTLHSQRELFTDWTGKLYITQTYDDGYASENYNGPNHREVGAQLLWELRPALELHAGWQHSRAGEDVRRDGGDDLSWGQVGLAWSAISECGPASGPGHWQNVPCPGWNSYWGRRSACRRNASPP